MLCSLKQLIPSKRFNNPYIYIKIILAWTKIFAGIFLKEKGEEFESKEE